MWLATAATAATGWLEAGKGEWCSDLCGELTDDHAEGGALGDLEAETGQQYPDLQAKRQAVVDAWRAFQRAWPWGKDSAKANYEVKAQEFASALEAKTISVSPGGVSLGGFFEQFKGQSPMIWVFIISILVMTVVLVAFRRPRRR